MSKKNILLFLSVAYFSMNIISCGFKNIETDNYRWKLTFEDNFDKFDTLKWITFYDSGGRTNRSNRELQWYKDENVSVENGILKLTAKKETIYGKDSEGTGQFDFTSGMICTSFGFIQAYGKWEVRAKFPFRKGFWPAFWLVAKQKPGLPEIDVFEYFGIKKNKILSTHHWGLDYPNYSGGVYEGKTEPFYYSDGKETEGIFSDVWMTWSFECFPNNMIWKLDGSVVYEATEGIPTAPLYVIANVAVKKWAENNYEVDNTDLPYIMEIDYVRVYKMIPVN